MKVHEIVKLVEADGWVHVRTTGSHRIYAHAAKPGRVVIAGKRSQDLKIGTERSILRQAGLWRRS